MAQFTAEEREKVCTKCKLAFPATAQFFNKHRLCSDGLYSICKKCKAEQDRQYREANREKLAQKDRKYYEANKSRLAEQNRQYYLQNAEKTKAYSRQWHAENRERLNEQSRQYYSNNQDERREKVRQYKKDNPEKVRVMNRRRDARKRDLPATLSLQDWQYALDYFNGCCAVCGEQAHDLFGGLTIAADHWIPLSKGGGTTPENIIPLCHGLNGCNNTKSSKEPKRWLAEQYSVDEASQIISRIEAYFECVRSAEDV